MLFIGPKILLRPKRTTSALYRKKGIPAFPSDVGLPSEDIALTTHDGLSLRGWLIRTSAQPKGTILYFHGIEDNKALGLPLAKLFFENGYNTVMVDFRAHGESEGTYCTYGFYEKEDVKSIINAITALPDFSSGKIGVYGLSMGAAIALQTAAIDERIACVVAENSFATLHTIFDDYQRRIIKLPFHYLRNLIIARSEYLASFDAKVVSPLDAVRYIRVPLLFIVGMQDEKIHPRYSQMLFDAATAPKDMFVIEQGNHVNVREIAGKQYDEKLLSFFEQHLT